MSSSPSVSRLVAWGASVAVVLIVGLAMFVFRSALLPKLEALPDLASSGKSEALTPAPLPPRPEVAAPVPEQPSGPQLTYEDVETMLAPLPDQVLTLIGDGQGELPDYRDIASEDEATASRSRRFFQTWGNTWNNRIARLEAATPPWEECEIHAPLVATCEMLAEAYGLLRTVPSVESVDDGQVILEQARQFVEDFLNPPEEEDEGEDEESAGDDEGILDG